MCLGWGVSYNIWSLRAPLENYDFFSEKIVKYVVLTFDFGKTQENKFLSV